jgi:pimeloyl-ACP methyl ester carboxylesterase
VPTHVVWDDADPFFPAAQGERTARLVTDEGLTVLPGAGHFLPEERPEELAVAIRALVG